MSSIGILLPDLRGGGAERVSLDLAYEIQRTGHEVEFVLKRAEGEFLQEAHRTFPIVDLGVRRVRQVPLALSRYLRQRRPDALLAAMWPLTVVAPLARRLSAHRCAIVVAEHSTLSSQYRSRGRAHAVAMRASMAMGYRLADARVGVSTGVAHDLAALSAMRACDFHVVHNPVPVPDVPDAAAIVAAEALWGVERGARVLTVGNHKEAKNHPLLLRSFALMATPNSRLMLVGQGGKEGELRALARQLGIAERVIFAGFRRDPTPFYMTADLFALTSNREGLPTALIEALACGLPVVSTDCPSGPAEILDSGRWGRLTPVGDAQAFAKAMIEALSADQDRDELRRRAADFSPEIAARKYLNLLLPKQLHTA